MRKFEKILVLLSSGVAMLMPVFAYAAAGGLVPCGTAGAAMCRACDLVTLIQNILSFLIALSIPIAVAMFAWAGVLYFTNAADPKNIGKAKKIFKNALLGFVITISAWLIINTLLNAVLSKSFYTDGTWFYVKCYTPTPDQTIGQVLNNTLGALPQPGPSAPGTEGAGGSLYQINTKAKNGTALSLGFSTSRGDQELNSTYSKVLNQYGSHIAAACQNSSLPNCQEKVAAIIVAESSGNPNQTSARGAIGIMQVLPGNAMSGCNLQETACNLNSGIKYLTAQYNTFGNNFVNATAAYNGGPSGVPGSSPSGLTPSMAASQDCPGYYAYQCGINPGGLVETQQYVANICRTLVLAKQSC